MLKKIFQFLQNKTARTISSFVLILAPYIATFNTGAIVKYTSITLFTLASIVYLAGTFYTNKLESREEQSAEIIKNLRNKNKKITKRIKELQNDIAVYGCAFKKHIDPIVKKIYNELKLNEDSRISIYYYSCTVDKMFLVGRHSSSVKFNKVDTWVISDQTKYVFSVLNLTEHQCNELKPSNDTTSIMQGKSMYGVPIETKEGIKIAIVLLQHMEQDAWASKQKRKQIKKAIQSNKMDIIKILSQNHIDEFANNLDDTFDRQLMEKTDG